MSTHPFRLGDFAEEILVTDSRVLQVVRATRATITVRTTKRGENVADEFIGGNPLPVTYNAVVPDPDGHTRTLRMRKDGTFRTMRGGNPLTPAATREGRTVTRTDYRA